MGVNGHCGVHKSLPLGLHPVSSASSSHSVPSAPIFITMFTRTFYCNLPWARRIVCSHCVSVAHTVILSTSLQSGLSRVSQLRFYIPFDRLIPSHSCHWWCVQVRTAEWIRRVAVFICRRADPSLSSSKNCVFKSMWVMSWWIVLAVSKLCICCSNDIHICGG